MKNLSRKETCWAILQQVPTYLIAVLSLLICGFLTVASLFSLAVMRMDEIPVLGELPEQLVLADRNVLHVAPVVAVLSILLLLLARQNFTWKHAKIVTWVAAAVQTIFGLLVEKFVCQQPGRGPGHLLECGGIPGRAPGAQRGIAGLPALLAVPGSCRHDR